MKATTQLNTAYDAYLNNPQAAAQILQATARGAPTGLQGLAAAAAQNTVKQDQMAAAGAQRPGVQPTVVQQMAQMPGIMGQLPSNIGLAQAPTTPAPAPQGMAGGGLVAFADGGLVLPPDVIDAIQSHFAEGGGVHFSEYPLRPIGETANPIYSDYSELPVDAPAVTYADVPVPKEQSEEGISGYWSNPREYQRTIINDLINKAEGKLEGSGIARGIEALIGRVAGAKERWGQRLEDIEARHARHLAGKIGSEDDGISLLQAEGFEPTGMYKPEVSETPKDDQGKKIPTPAVWKPESTSGHEVTAKPEVHPEGQNLAPEFDKAKLDLPTAPEADKKEQAGLGALGGGGLEALRDQLMELSGHKTMSPELSQKLEDLQSSARTSTILQTILGGLAGGLSSPWGGRIAMGKAAAGALGGYEHGIGAEDALGANAFNILKGYEDAPAEEKAAAMKAIMGQLGKTAELQSEERRALLKPSLSLQERMLLKQTPGAMNPYQQTMVGVNEQNLRDKAVDNAERAIKEENETRSKGLTRTAPVSDAEREAFYRRAFAALGLSYPGSAPGSSSSTVQSGGTGGAQAPIKLTWDK